MTDDGEKLSPERLELRARPRPIRRLNKRTLMIGCGIVALVIAGATIMALSPPSQLSGHDANADRTGPVGPGTAETAPYGWTSFRGLGGLSLYTMQVTRHDAPCILRTSLGAAPGADRFRYRSHIHCVSAHSKPLAEGTRSPLFRLRRRYVVAPAGCLLTVLAAGDWSPLPRHAKPRR
jgi:hypothetical protein